MYRFFTKKFLPENDAIFESQNLRTSNVQPFEFSIVSKSIRRALVSRVAHRYERSSVWKAKCFLIRWEQGQNNVIGLMRLPWSVCMVWMSWYCVIGGLWTRVLRTPNLRIFNFDSIVYVQCALHTKTDRLACDMMNYIVLHCRASFKKIEKPEIFNSLIPFSKLGEFLKFKERIKFSK